MNKILPLLIASAAIALAAASDGNQARLNAALTQARLQRLDDLHEYAEKGVFPHNHGYPEQRVPYFMDRHGRLCAVGYLIAKSMAGKDWNYDRFMRLKNIAVKHSGGGEIIPDSEEYKREQQEEKEADDHLLKLLGFFNNIATTNNNIRIKDVQSGPVLDWILRSGLTQEEAALIQPSYSFLACDDCLPGSERSPVEFGRRTEESKRIEGEDRIRIRAHLLKTESLLRQQSALSLKTCVARLQARESGNPPALEIPAH